MHAENGVCGYLKTTVRYFIVEEKRKLIELGEGYPGFHSCSAITFIYFLVNLLNFWNLNSLPRETDSTSTIFFFFLHFNWNQRKVGVVVKSIGLGNSLPIVLNPSSITYWCLHLWRNKLASLSLSCLFYKMYLIIPLFWLMC